MKLIFGLSLTAGLLAAYLLTSAATLASEEGPTTLKDRKSVAGGRRVPVLVELFTSEGCSSCPPADAELTALVRDQPFPNVEVVALSQHVDYWNNLGWRDPFSAAAFSARQGEYGRAFRLGSVYTPQMVVDGRTEFVGSDEARATAAIRNAAKAPKATVTLRVAEGVAQIAVSHAPARNADVMLAIAEDGLTSNVRAGENSGRRLAHVAVVRSLRRVGRLAADGTFSGSAPLALDPTWKRDELSAIVFVQEPNAGRVLGAAQVAAD